MGWEVSGAGLTLPFSLSYDLFLVQEAYQKAPVELRVADLTLWAGWLPIIPWHTPSLRV